MPTDPLATAACRCPDCGSLDVSSIGGGTDRCASCGTTWPHATAAGGECGRCGERFADRDLAQRHADVCDRPTMRVTDAQRCSTCRHWDQAHPMKGGLTDD